MDHEIMRAPRRALQCVVRLEIEVEMPHRCDVRVDDEAGLQILHDISLARGPAVLFVDGEEAGLMPLPDNDESDKGRVDRDGAATGVGRNGGEFAGVDDLRQFVSLDGGVLGVGDAVAVEKNTCGEVAVCFLPGEEALAEHVSKLSDDLAVLVRYLPVESWSAYLNLGLLQTHGAGVVCEMFVNTGNDGRN